MPDIAHKSHLENGFVFIYFDGLPLIFNSYLNFIALYSMYYSSLQLTVCL